MPEALSRLQKHFIGSDNFFNLPFDTTGFPPYNIEKLSQDTYKLTLAVAGYTRDELNIEVEGPVISISGSKATRNDDRVFLHQGIAERDFKREFRLMQNTYVKNAEYKDGLLCIYIQYEIPEELKARTVNID
jgi:molecular chaperone IbpA